MNQQQQQQPPGQLLQQQQQQQPQLLQLIDEDEWFHLHSLRAAGDESDERVTASDVETRQRVAQEASYQQAVTAQIFAEEDRLSNTHSKDQKRRDQLREWNHERIDIVTTNVVRSCVDASSDGSDPGDEGESHRDNELVVIRTNLMELASRSDTVFAMASNRHLFHSGNSNDNGKNDSSNHGVDNTPCSATAQAETETSRPTNLSLSLCDYSTESVRIFLKALLSLPTPTVETAKLSGTNAECSTPDTTATNIEDDAEPQDIPPECVIDCCRLAHYLQCQQLLDSIVDDYLMAPGSIDHENCRFLCKLADELSLPRLWEASVNHMLSSLDKFETTTTSTEATSAHDACLWDDLSPALKAEIQALRGILRSSHRQKVYFSTYHEYLGLLAEQHQYYKERLEDAQHSQRNVAETEATLRQELERLQAQEHANGVYRNRRLQQQLQSTRLRLEGVVRGREYAAAKIDKQQQKVAALRALWMEQKQVFGGGSHGGGDGGGGSRFQRKR